jgi:hypothetical protein
LAIAILELDVVVSGAQETASISTRPSVAFHGNIQMAVSEGRAIVERG